MMRATRVRLFMALVLVGLVHTAACKPDTHSDSSTEQSKAPDAEVEHREERPGLVDPAPAPTVEAPAPIDVAADGVFAGLRVRSHSGAIDDFGHLLESAATFYESAPNDEEIVAVVERAVRAGIPIRIRGAGHSMHGGSLPKEAELLLRTTNVRSYAFTEPGTVTVGSGVSIHGFHVFMSERGFLVPVFNGGGFGPTVGGYVSAGGFGPLSGEYGGFWENVEELELIDGNGERVVLNRSDPDFPWVFGAFGQLGVIVKAKLRILPMAENVSYPAGETGSVPHYAQEATSVEAKTPIWLTIFGPAEDLPEMTAEIAKLRERFDVLDYESPEDSRYQNLGQYDFPIKFFEFTPPLVNPHQGDLVGHGLWGFVKESVTVPQLRELVRAYHNLVMSRERWTRYIGTEPLAPDFDHRAYLGDELFGKFLVLKRKYDPRVLINRGTVFSVEEVASPN